MVSKGFLLLSVHGLVFFGAALALWAVSAGAAVRYDTATPYTPPYNRYKYIPLHPNYERYEPDIGPPEPQQSTPSSGMAPSELILTGLRTILDVVRNINKKRASQKALAHPAVNSTTVQVDRIAQTTPAIVTGGTEAWKEARLEKGNSRVADGRYKFDKPQFVHRTSLKNATEGSGRGFDDYYDEHHDEPTTTTTPKPMKQGRYTDPWAGYYDWIINEGSFKFWSVFQLFTAALLLYACLSAIYYAKFNPIIPDYSMEYDDYFLQRTVGRNARSVEPYERPSGLSWINSSTFQFILNAISKHYEEE